MLLLIKYTLLYGIVLMLVALVGMFSEHSGIINIALEGIMVIGGVAGVLTLTMLPADAVDHTLTSELGTGNIFGTFQINDLTVILQIIKFATPV